MKLLFSFLLICFSCLQSNLSFGQFDDEPVSPLIAAVEANNLKEVKRLVEAGEPIQNENGYGDDPIDIAVQKDYREITLYLLSKGATSRENFYSAVSTGDLNWIKTLVGYKFYDSEAMIPAVESGKIEIVKYLISQGFPVDFEQKRRKGLFRKYYVSPLETALDKGANEIVIELVKAGAPLLEAFYRAANYDNNDLGMKLIDLGRQTNDLFLSCAETDNITLLKYCIQKGAEPNTKDKLGKNALLISAQNGRREMFMYCMNQLNLSTNSLSLENENALMLSLKSNNGVLITELMAINPNLEWANTEGETVLFYAERSPAKDIFDLILSKHPKIDHKNKVGNTVLMTAASEGQLENVSKLIAAGADIQTTNSYGKNIISYLINGNAGSKKLILEMMDKGIKPTDSDAKTIAFYSIETLDYVMLDRLKSMGFSIDGRNSSNQRPTIKDIEMVHYVLENGGDPDARDSWYRTYLCSALESNDLELAGYLLKHNANPNIPSCFMDELLLVEAVKKDNLLFVQLLVENKADLYVKNRWSNNIMEIALEEKNEEIIAYLRMKGALTKDEINKREVERAKEMQVFAELVKSKNASSLLAFIKKYPEATFSKEEIKSLALVSGQTGSIELLQICLEKFKWDINQSVNFEEQSILHISVKNKYVEYSILVVNKGGKADQEDAFGKTPADYAKDQDLKLFFKNLDKRKK